MQTNELRARIVLAGYTQQSLAKAIGMSKNTLCAKINGKTQFKLPEIERICDVLSIRDPEEKAHIFLSNSSQ